MEPSLAAPLIGELQSTLADASKAARIVSEQAGTSSDSQALHAALDKASELAKLLLAEARGAAEASREPSARECAEMRDAALHNAVLYRKMSAMHQHNNNIRSYQQHHGLAVHHHHHHHHHHGSHHHHRFRHPHDEVEEEEERRSRVRALLARLEAIRAAPFARVATLPLLPIADAAREALQGLDGLLGLSALPVWNERDVQSSEQLKLRVEKATTQLLSHSSALTKKEQRRLRKRLVSFGQAADALISVMRACTAKTVHVDDFLRAARDLLDVLTPRILKNQLLGLSTSSYESNGYASL